MKIRYFLIACFLIVCFTKYAHAQIQSDPTHWAYGLKKIAGDTYEVHLQCTIDPNWHIYAQKQGKDFIGTATKISFEKQPGLVLLNKPLEIGKKDTYTVKEVGISNFEYANKVDFVQKIMIKPGIKEVKGTIAYQTCTHEHCLSATSLNFTIPVN